MLKLKKKKLKIIIQDHFYRDTDKTACDNNNRLKKRKMKACDLEYTCISGLLFFASCAVLNLFFVFLSLLCLCTTFEVCETVMEEETDSL